MTVQLIRIGIPVTEIPYSPGMTIEKVIKLAGEDISRVPGWAKDAYESLKEPFYKFCRNGKEVTPDEVVQDGDRIVMFVHAPYLPGGPYIPMPYIGDYVVD